MSDFIDEVGCFVYDNVHNIMFKYFPYAKYWSCNMPVTTKKHGCFMLHMNVNQFTQHVVAHVTCVHCQHAHINMHVDYIIKVTG